MSDNWIPSAAYERCIDCDAVIDSVKYATPEVRRCAECRSASNTDA
jgi:RNA polymerase-binding transcription factor DksA